VFIGNLLIVPSLANAYNLPSGPIVRLVYIPVVFDRLILSNFTILSTGSGVDLVVNVLEYGLNEVPHRSLTPEVI
jgi:hypothetical protein